MVENKNNSSVFEINILYLLIGLLLVFVGAKVQGKEVYSGLLITEYLIILMPTLLYLKIKGHSIKETLKLNRITFKQAIIIVLIVIFSYPVAVFFNFIGIMILSKFVAIKPNPVPIPSTPSQYLIGFLVIALAPGICEETMFRGMMMSSYESLGKKRAIIYSAILFGIFHFNAQNLLGPIFLGVLFGIILYKTNSLFSTMIGHTVNNTVALTLGYMLNNVDAPVDSINISSGGQILVGIILLGLVVVSGFISYLLINSLPERDPETVREMDNFLQGEALLENLNRKERLSLIECFPILIVIIIFIIRNYKYLSI